MIRFLFTTEPGLEDVVENEFEARVGAAGFDGSACSFDRNDFSGEIRVTVMFEPPFSSPEVQKLRDVARAMRAATRAFRLADSFDVAGEDALTGIVDRLRRTELPELADARSFRVTAYRRGDHDFTRIDIQRAAGRVLEERAHSRVELKQYELEVVVTLQDTRCRVMVNLAGRSEAKRFPRVYSSRVGTRPTIAHALLRLAGVYGNNRTAPSERAPLAPAPSEPVSPDPGTPESAPADASTREPAAAEQGHRLRILDPFCGSGTIALEAAATLPDADVRASDLDPSAVAGTQKNVEAAGYARHVSVRSLDARRLTDLYEPESVEYIVTNPPYGVRVGDRMHFRGLYHAFLAGAATVLKERGVVCTTVGRKRGAFVSVLGELGLFDVLDMRMFETGGMYPLIFVLRKKSGLSQT